MLALNRKELEAYREKIATHLKICDDLLSGSTARYSEPALFTLYEFAQGTEALKIYEGVHNATKGWKVSNEM